MRDAIFLCKPRSHPQGSQKRSILRAPLSSRSKRGTEKFRAHWDKVAKVRTGDLIFCHPDNYIRGMVIAQCNSYVAERPPRASFKEWQTEGHRVDISYNALKRPVRSDGIAEIYIAKFYSRTQPRLFNIVKGITQIYMTSLPADALNFHNTSATRHLSLYEIEAPISTSRSGFSFTRNCSSNSPNPKKSASGSTNPVAP